MNLIYNKTGKLSDKHVKYFRSVCYNEPCLCKNGLSLELNCDSRQAALSRISAKVSISECWEYGSMQRIIQTE